MIKTLNAAINEVANDPEVLKHVARYRRGGVPEGHAHRRPRGEKYLKSEIARWGKVIKDNNIHANQ